MQGVYDSFPHCIIVYKAHDGARSGGSQIREGQKITLFLFPLTAWNWTGADCPTVTSQGYTQLPQPTLFFCYVHNTRYSNT